MKNFKRFTTLFIPLLLVALVLAGEARAALLDLGPVVPQVNPSTEPNLGHGYPLWYRDNNRVPLEICTDRVSGMCLTAEPFPLQPLSFPTNMGPELFYWVGDATIDIPQQGALTRAGKALLVQAVEAAYSTGHPVPDTQITFARIRIRIDTPYAGDYTVTTPFKAYTFTVDPALVADGIRYVEDIGIQNGVFTGALAGNVGPFLYCVNAPISAAGGSFLGDPNVPCQVLGSTFPSAQNPSNYFRVQGPNGFNVQTNLFTVMGKIYTAVTPTPLTVDRVSYTRESLGAQVAGYVTTQPLSNQTVAAPFPGNFALAGIPSAVQITGSGVPTVSMTTNNAADGNFYGSSGLFADPGALPATVTVTNTTDVPQTAKVVPLVDEVTVDAALYNPGSGRLTVSATSYDRIAAPSLALHIPGIEGPVAALVNGQGSVTFPLTDNSANPVKTYNIPPEQVRVVSAKGGSASRAVTSLPPGAANHPPVAINDFMDVAAGSTAIIDVILNDTDQDPGDIVVGASLRIVTQGVHGTATAQSSGTVSYAANPGFVGTDTFTYTVHDGFGAISNTATVTVNILDGALNTAPVAVDDAFATAEDTPVTFNLTANDTDAENNLLRGGITFVTHPANGTLTLGTGGNVTYTPALNFNGANSFTYQVRDSLGLVSNTATVNLTVNAVNDPPVAVADSAVTNEDTPVTFNVTDNDTDVDGVIAVNSVQIATQPLNGQVAAHPDGSVTYTPNLNFFGTSTFTYTVSDGTATSAPATVTVTVNPVNDPPVAVNDVATIPAATPITINVIGNDRDVDGTINASSVTIVSQPAHGGVTVNPTGTVVYTSNAGFNGVDIFSYTVRDNSGAVSAPATVSVSVTAAASETVNVLRAQVKLSTREWRIDGVITTPASTSVNVYIGRDLTGTLLGTATVNPDGTWNLRVAGSNANPLPDASNTVSAQGVPGGGTRLAFPLAIR
ncbi:tandem-95 repeat protein [Citrifermentans bremense]|uniref:tandem-95 repeat protein n=1 Tax=Citrifermentans bremense TaxID=60035 RepID=UPI000424D68A|nr:Ig-like domain-containing protein [Citrifermentans bremense]